MILMSLLDLDKEYLNVTQTLLLQNLWDWDYTISLVSLGQVQDPNPKLEFDFFNLPIPEPKSILN